jgi:hypothetical protein
MNEPQNNVPEIGSGADTASLESGSVLLDRIASTPPQAEPVLIAEREKTTAKSASFSTNEAKPDAPPDASSEAGEPKILRVDPKDYARVTDYKGRPFNPSMHKVKADGTPDFNARGKVKMLTEGERNPVRLILDPLAKLIPKEPEPTPEVCEAQAAAIIDDSKSRINAECIADLYCGTGYILRGGRFIKRWEKERRPRIVNGLLNYERQVPGGLMQAAPWLVLAHVFASDIVTVEGGERFDSGGGLIGLLRRFRQRRNEAKQAHEAEKGAADVA